MGILRVIQKTLRLWRALHRANGLVLHVRQYVRLGVHCVGDRGVSQHLLNYLGVYAFAERKVAAVCRRSCMRPGSPARSTRG
jgi:hypothetical protein